MSDEPVHAGGCLCGAVRYRISGPIDSVCHCVMCRRSSGATFAAAQFLAAKLL